MSLVPELDGLSVGDLRRAFEGPPVDGDDGAVAFYQEVADRLGAAGDLATLWHSTAGATLPRKRALVLALSQYDPNTTRVREWMRSLLEGEPELIAEAIDGLARIEDREVLPELLALRNDASEWVRGAVVRYARRIQGLQALPYLEEAMHDVHFIVRENVADELAELGDPKSRPLLERLITDPHPHVRQAAQAALEQLAD